MGRRRASTLLRSSQFPHILNLLEAVFSVLPEPQWAEDSPFFFQGQWDDFLKKLSLYVVLNDLHFTTQLSLFILQAEALCPVM